ncbi:Hexosyltransferase [Sarracenia purpurea var. burkii]
MDDGRHVLVVAFPGQGLLNPSLQFAKRLAKMGVKVTFFTAFSALNRMPNNTIPVPHGVTVVGFSDGYDDGFDAGCDITLYVSELRRLGSQAVRELLKDSAESGRPFVRVIYTTLLFWVAEVARNLHFPSTLLWVQPATLLDIYYFYFNGYGDSILSNHGGDPSWSVELPGLPPLASGDLPSFLISSNKNAFALPMFKEHIEVLESEKHPKILVNSFDALELQALRAIDKFKLVGIGPLLPSAFLDGKDPSDTSFGGDLFRKSGGCVEWLSSKADGSVVYISFGSVCVVSKQQKEEIARGLLASRRAFLWVIREGTEENERRSIRTLILVLPPFVSVSRPPLLHFTVAAPPPSPALSRSHPPPIDLLPVCASWILSRVLFLLHSRPTSVSPLDFQFLCVLFHRLLPPQSQAFPKNSRESRLGPDQSPAVVPYWQLRQTLRPPEV